MASIKRLKRYIVEHRVINISPVDYEGEWLFTYDGDDIDSYY